MTCYLCECCSPLHSILVSPFICWGQWESLSVLKPPQKNLFSTTETRLYEHPLQLYVRQNSLWNQFSLSLPYSCALIDSCSSAKRRTRAKLAAWQVQKYSLTGSEGEMERFLNEIKMQIGFISRVSFGCFAWQLTCQLLFFLLLSSDVQTAQFEIKT